MVKRGDPEQTLMNLMKQRRMVRTKCHDCGYEAEHSPVYFANFSNLPYDMTLWEKCGSRHVGIEPRGDAGCVGFVIVTGSAVPAIACLLSFIQSAIVNSS